MDGKYLAESRSEMLEAVEQSRMADEEQNRMADEDNHGLLSLGALTEAFTELEARVTQMETHVHCNICASHEVAGDAPASAAA
jgi:hypothetical protein